MLKMRENHPEWTGWAGLAHMRFLVCYVIGIRMLYQRESNESPQETSPREDRIDSSDTFVRVAEE